MIGVPIIYNWNGGVFEMGRKKLSTTKKHRMDYNADYQKAYVKRYVFKLNTKHDQELIEQLEKIDNKNSWFKKQLSEGM
jgi:hypothetical protein